jgi:hypothetical protein
VAVLGAMAAVAAIFAFESLYLRHRTETGEASTS